MVKSTIDDIKDITLERQIRKLAGVIDKQNEVINNVGNVDARITAVEDSTANNTVQINSVKEDVSKNTIAIANISNRVTNVEQSTEAIPGIQTEINGINQSLVSNVTATFDNPSRELKISLGREASPSIDATVVIPASSETGQYSAGNGITIQDYQIAVDTNVVALKTDIPVVPDVTNLTQRVTTLETEMPTKASVDSVNALETTVNSNTENITNLTNKNTEQDTAINGKVAIAQGTENAGKVLGIGADGNVTPVNAGGSSGGGEVWEIVDLANWPTNWVANERVKIQFSLQAIGYADSWSGSINGHNLTGGNQNENYTSPLIEITIPDKPSSGFTTHKYPFYCRLGNNTLNIVSIETIRWVEDWNGSTYNDIISLTHIYINGNSGLNDNINITKTGITTFVNKMWRLKKST